MTLAFCSGSKNQYGRLSGLFDSWLSFFLVSLAVEVSAAPHSDSDGLHRRDSSSSNSPGSISMSVWLPILVVTMVFLLVSLCTCVRRCAANQAAATAANRAASSASADTNVTNTTRNRRRPQRTPSQISTRSLPAYMKEPGDHELVLSRGPDEEMPLPMPTLAEDDEEHAQIPNATFDIELNRMESMDTMPDSSTATLVRGSLASLSRPPNITMPRNHRRSGDARSSDSVGSEAELLSTHQRSISVDNPLDSRGEAPPYSEAVAATTTTNVNDPDLSSNPAITPPPHTADPAAGRRPRFSFLTRNPFSPHNNTNNASANANTSPTARADSPASHTRSGSALTRFSSRESHESHHSRTPSRNNNLLSRGHNHSNSSLFRTFHSQSPGPQAASSTITLDNISAPLTHTVTRAEFRVPKGGLLTPEQVKLITSRDALERFGIPYGPDAVAAFSLSREMPPPGFESIAGEQGGGSGTSDVAVDTTTQTADISELNSAPPRSTSLTPDELEGQAQSVQVGATEDDEPRTAQTMTPGTARPMSESTSVGHRL